MQTWDLWPHHLRPDWTTCKQISKVTEALTSKVTEALTSKLIEASTSKVIEASTSFLDDKESLEET